MKIRALWIIYMGRVCVFIGGGVGVINRSKHFFYQIGEWNIKNHTRNKLSNHNPVVIAVVVAY